MSEPSSGVPGEIADADVETQQPPEDTPERVELDVDQEKLDAWDDVKSDYQVDPDAGSSAGGQESDDSSPADEGEEGEGEEDEGTEEEKAGEDENQGEVKDAGEKGEDQREDENQGGVKDAGEKGEDQREDEDPADEDEGEDNAG